MRRVGADFDITAGPDVLKGTYTLLGKWERKKQYLPADMRDHADVDGLHVFLNRTTMAVMYRDDPIADVGKGTWNLVSKDRTYEFTSAQNAGPS